MIQIKNYGESELQFEVVDGNVMANATVMAKAFGKDMSSIFSTKSWGEFEQAVSEATGINSVDLRRSKPGQPVNGGGTWIHQELVIEFSRRINPKFSLWCNRTIADLLKTGTVTIKQKSTAEQLLETALAMVEHEQRLVSLESKVESLVESKAEAIKQLDNLPLSTEEAPVESEQTQVNRLVNSYCELSGISHHDTWNKLYSDMYYKYQISLKTYKKLPGERTYLDVANRLGHCAKLKILISAMINDLGRMAS